MAQPLRTTLVPDQTIDAAAGTDSWNLPPNPLSAILITIRALNETSTLTNYSALAALFAKFSNFSVRYRGASIFDADALDAAMVAMIIARWAPKQGQINNTDNNVRSITFPILFGKKYGDPSQCFPATRSGDLILSADWAADAAGLDNFSLQVETLELLDAAPESFIKVTTSARTMTAGIGNQLDLPTGNKILGVMLRANTFPTGASFNSSFGQMALKIDNTEAYYSEVNWESVQGELTRMVPPAWQYPAHVHTENTAAAYAQNATTLGGMIDIAAAQQYGYLDFDPMGDQSMGLETAGATRIMIANNSDVADGADSFWLPIERVQVATAA
jgi:hypothetical protein